MRRTLGLAVLLVHCGGDAPKVWECQIPEGEDPDSVSQLGCEADFDAMASEPLVAMLSGARSDKTIVDQADGDTLYFQDSERFQIHWDFASEHLSGNGLPIVPELGTFNLSEYYAPTRRFLLGAVTHYEAQDVWVYEIAPYDTADAAMITKAFRKIAHSSYFGERLAFHPTSEAVESVAEGLPSDVPVVTTDELFAGVTYQPYNVGEAYGLLRFYSLADLETGYVGFREVVVLEDIPNDISVVAGVVTSEFQTPLSHIAVLAQNRGTPDMALRGAFDDPSLRALEGKWVRIEVRDADYTIEETTQAEADAWWEAHRPSAVQVPDLDLAVTDLLDAEVMLDVAGLGLGPAIDAAIPAFGGKASNFAALSLVPEDVLVPEGFGIPVYYYWQFMTENGFFDQVDEILADEALRADPALLAPRLEALRTEMEAASVNAAFQALLLDKLQTKWPENPRFKLRSSTNAEDLDGFTGAGLYESFAADVDDPAYPVFDALRKVWASIWGFRAFEEREYRSIDHHAVAMAIQVNTSFTDEEANGVAITANIFDRAGLEPAFFVNAQYGESSVVLPELGVTTDQFLYYYELPNQPIVFIGHSNLVLEGETVLTREQTYELGTSLAAIHAFFREAYGGDDCYAMDTEWKLDDVGGELQIWVKQARPYSSWCE